MIILCWKEISVEQICKSISAWKKGLRLVVEHFEHRLENAPFILHFFNMLFEFDNTQIATSLLDILQIC